MHSIKDYVNKISIMDATDVSSTQYRQLEIDDYQSLRVVYGHKSLSTVVHLVCPACY